MKIVDTSAKFRCGCKRFFIVDVSIFLSRSTSFLDFLLEKVYNLKTKSNSLQEFLIVFLVLV